MADPDRFVLTCLIRAVCPEPVEPVLEDVLAEAQLMIDALPPLSARAMGTGLVALDQLTRLTRLGLGRPFRRLRLDEQRALLEGVLGGKRSAIPIQLVVPLRTLVVAAYYDHPEVRRSLGYTPEAWVADATARRLGLVPGDPA
jgi:hypothetical protein